MHRTGIYHAKTIQCSSSPLTVTRREHIYTCNTYMAHSLFTLLFWFDVTKYSKITNHLQVIQLPVYLSRFIFEFFLFFCISHCLENFTLTYCYQFSIQSLHSRTFYSLRSPLRKPFCMVSLTLLPIFLFISLLLQLFLYQCFSLSAIFLLDFKSSFL